MDAWVKSGMEGSAERAQAIHDAMIRMYHETHNQDLAPSIVSYNTLISGWTKSFRLDRAEQVLQEMLAVPHLLRPDATSFAHLIHGYSNLVPTPNIQRAQELFRWMDDLGIEKTFYIYGALQNAHARSHTPTAPFETKALLDEMLQNYASNRSIWLKPTVINFNTVLNACSRSPSIASAQLARDLLHTMLTDDTHVPPDRLSYMMALYACASCPDERVGAPMAQKILQRMEQAALDEWRLKETAQSMAPLRVTLGTEAYNAVVSALARSGLPQSVSHIRDICRRMEQLANECGLDDVYPNRRTYNSLLNAMVRTTGIQHAEAMAEEATKIMRTMWELDAQGKAFSKPDSYSYTAILILHQKSLSDAAPEKVDDLIREMEQLHQDGLLENAPDVVHYTIAVSTWARARTRGTVHRCSQILLHMMERHRAGFPNCVPNSRTYNAFIDGLSRAREEERAEKVLYYMLDQYRQGNADMAPDSFSFNSVLIAFCKSRRKGAGERAESILDRLLQYSEEENTSVEPNERSFSIIINYYCQSKQPDAPYRAEFLLNRMVDMCRMKGACLPDISSTCFSMVLEAYAAKRLQDGGERAERLLRVMKELQKLPGSSKIRIDANILSSVMLAIANSNDELAGQKAEYHLEAMERKFSQGDERMRPTTRSYGIALSAWTRSPMEGKAQRALAVLRRMEDQIKNGNKEVSFNPFAKSLVINACSFSNRSSREEAEAYQIAIQVFEEMVESTDRQRTLSVTYGWFLQSLGRLSVDEADREWRIERAFCKCCEQGLVNDLVLSRLRGAASPALFDKLLNPVVNDDISMTMVRSNHLPLEWRRNISKRRDDERLMWKSPPSSSHK